MRIRDLGDGMSDEFIFFARVYIFTSFQISTETGTVMAIWEVFSVLLWRGKGTETLACQPKSA